MIEIPMWAYITLSIIACSSIGAWIGIAIARIIIESKEKRKNDKYK